jgi:hypothetical protein
MVKHMLDTWWPDDRVMPCAVYTVHVKMWSTSFFVEPKNQGLRFLWVWPQNHWLSFPVWASKSLQRFLGLGFKTKRALVCRLHHKTNRGRSTWDTRQDIAACFA